MQRFAAFILAAAATFDAQAARSDVVTDWVAVLTETILTVPDPSIQLRTQTITELAVFDAVNSIVGDYDPYLRRIPAPAGASPDAAAIIAAHDALVALVPDRAAELEAARDASLATIPDGPAKIAGIVVGTQAAKAIVAARVDDGFEDVVPYTPGTEPGDWQPTPPGFAPAFGAGLGQVKPFAIESGAQFRVPPPPDLDSRRYARDYNEVRIVGDVNSETRPPDRTDVARFYNVTDVEMWYSAASQASLAQGRTLSENAHTFGLLAIAICDAAIAVFDSKYHYEFWRPVTAIRAGDTDDNPRTAADSTWTPLVETPPFPSYPSGHGGFGHAARVVLDRLLGPDGHDITLTNPEVPDIVLHYTSWEEINRDVDEARIYGGVHYRFDQEAAARQGARVGTYVLAHVLQPACVNGSSKSCANRSE